MRIATCQECGFIMGLGPDGNDYHAGSHPTGVGDEMHTGLTVIDMPDYDWEFYAKDIGEWLSAHPGASGDMLLADISSL